MQSGPFYPPNPGLSPDLTLVKWLNDPFYLDMSFKLLHISETQLFPAILPTLLGFLITEGISCPFFQSLMLGDQARLPQPPLSSLLITKYLESIFHTPTV